jgi:hypothetical protein
VNDHRPDPDRLGERMHRAVDDLRAPDVLTAAVAGGRRRRTRRRVAYGAGGLAAVTALALAVPAVADRAGGDPAADSTAPPVAVDPSPTASTTSVPTSAPATGCGGPQTGWWSTPGEQVRDRLAALLPAGVTIDGTDDEAAGVWGGNLVSGADADFASLTLLPPPGVRGGMVTLEDAAAAAEGACFSGDNDPMQPVEPCAEIPGALSCEEVRTDGELVGVVTQKVEQTVADGQDRPTDRAYVVATLAVPGGGHVELYVGEGTRADRPSTVHDPADTPTLTPQQALAVVADPVWTS